MTASASLKTYAPCLDWCGLPPWQQCCVTALRRAGKWHGGEDVDIEHHRQWCERQSGLSAATISQRLPLLRDLSTFLGRPLRTATREDLERWEGHRLPATAAVQTRRNYRAQVRQFYAWALAEGRVARDPSWPFEARRLPREERREVVASMADAGMSNRAIGSALGGVDEKLVRIDRRAGAEDSAPVDEPIDATVPLASGRPTVNDLGLLRPWWSRYESTGPLN